MLFNAIIPYMQGLDLYAIDFKYIYIFKKKKRNVTEMCLSRYQINLACSKAAAFVKIWSDLLQFQEYFGFWDHILWKTNCQPLAFMCKNWISKQWFNISKHESFASWHRRKKENDK